MLNEETEKLIWKHIDGECSPEEEILFQQNMEHDSSFVQYYEKILALNEELDLQEHETPSMRFSTNVMEALPRKSLARSVASLTPLRFFPKRFILFTSIMLVVAVASLFIFGYQPTGSTASVVNEIDEVTRQPIIMQISWIMIGCFGLILMDWFLNKKSSYRSTTPV